MAEHETIADIIAEIRALSNPISDGIIAINGKSIANRLEAAHRRESITPKSDPDWKDICAKCKDGDIEPKHCEYYGEPNGCNSPVYGEHPTAENSSAVGNAAKLREALDESRRIASGLGGCRLNDYWKLYEIVRVCEAALAAPPRNCDLPKVAEDPWRAWLDDESNWEDGSPKLEIHDWLLATATEKEGGKDANE